MSVSDFVIAQRPACGSLPNPLAPSLAFTCSEGAPHLPFDGSLDGQGAGGVHVGHDEERVRAPGRRRRRPGLGQERVQWQRRCGRRRRRTASRGAVLVPGRAKEDPSLHGKVRKRLHPFIMFA